MDKFVPYEKLSKKEKRKIDKSRRGTWDTNPASRVVPDKRKQKKMNEIIESQEEA